MKKIVVMLALASVLTLSMLGLATLPAFAGNGSQNDPFGPGDKVTFCHYDGSDNGGGGSGKYNQPDASTTATGPAGHIGHAFDVIPSYFFQQNANSQVEFFAGVNWPTLNNLPSSPVDFTPLLGSSAATFIASGCAEPVVTTSSPPPTCPSGTTTVTVTETAPPVTVTETQTVTAAASQQAGSFVPLTVEEECTQTTTKTVTPTVTVTKTITTTSPPVTSTTVPPTTTQPPRTTTTAATTTATTTATTAPPPPPSSTTPPPVGGGNPPPGPGGNPPPNNNPPNNPPAQLAFTGPEGITGWLGAHRIEAFAAFSLLAFGGALMLMRGWALGKEED